MYPHATNRNVVTARPLLTF